MGGTVRTLPAVQDILQGLSDLVSRYPRELVAQEVRQQIDIAREEAERGIPVSITAIKVGTREAFDQLEQPSLQRVINATGVVLHPGLGRAPLGRLGEWQGYTNLEHDVRTGQWMDRDTHTVLLLNRLLGVTGVVLNNNAAALFLTVHELAAGGEVIVSRRAVEESPEEFRLAELVTRAGARLRAVGGPDGAGVEEYRAAIGPQTRLIMLMRAGAKQKPGTAQAERREVAQLARESKIPLYENLGSGNLADPGPLNTGEHRPQEALLEGVNLVSFSCDKLLGGPQAGVVAGDRPLVRRVRANPMRRAMQADKLVYGALEEALRMTLFEQWDALPVQRMLRLTAESIRARAEEMAVGLLGSEVVAGLSAIGAGAAPGETLPTWLVSIEVADLGRALERLRTAEPPVVVRVEANRIFVDLRTVAPEEEGDLRRALYWALRDFG